MLNLMKSKLGMIGLIICGIAGLVLFVGLVSGLTRSIIRVSGIVLIASLVFTVYRLVKDRNA